LATGRAATPTSRREAHVEHPVGLVEHDHPECAEAQGAPLEVVVEAPRGRDDDGGPRREGAKLRPHGLAADENGGPEASPAPEDAERFGDLERELTRGCQHEGVDSGAGARERPREPLDDGNRERRGLAGARLGAADQVAAVENRTDRLGLDGSRNGIARGGDGLAHRGRERKIGKRTDHEWSNLPGLTSSGTPGPVAGPGRERLAKGGSAY